MRPRARRRAATPITLHGITQPDASPTHNTGHATQRRRHAAATGSQAVRNSEMKISRQTQWFIHIPTLRPAAPARSARSPPQPTSPPVATPNHIHAHNIAPPSRHATQAARTSAPYDHHHHHHPDRPTKLPRRRTHTPPGVTKYKHNHSTTPLTHRHTRTHYNRSPPPLTDRTIPQPRQLPAGRAL